MTSALAPLPPHSALAPSNRPTCTLHALLDRQVRRHFVMVRPLLERQCAAWLSECKNDSTRAQMERAYTEILQVVVGEGLPRRRRVRGCLTCTAHCGLTWLELRTSLHTSFADVRRMARASCCAKLIDAAETAEKAEAAPSTGETSKGGEEGAA